MVIVDTFKMKAKVLGISLQSRLDESGLSRFAVLCCDAACYQFSG